MASRKSIETASLGFLQDELGEGKIPATPHKNERGMSIESDESIHESNF